MSVFKITWASSFSFSYDFGLLVNQYIFIYRLAIIIQCKQEEYILRRGRKHNLVEQHHALCTDIHFAGFPKGSFHACHTGQCLQRDLKVPCGVVPERRLPSRSGLVVYVLVQLHVCIRSSLLCNRDSNHKKILSELSGF